MKWKFLHCLLTFLSMMSSAFRPLTIITERGEQQLFSFLASAHIAFISSHLSRALIRWIKRDLFSSLNGISESRRFPPRGERTSRLMQISSVKPVDHSLSKQKQRVSNQRRLTEFILFFVHICLPSFLPSVMEIIRFLFKYFPHHLIESWLA